MPGRQLEEAAPAPHLALSAKESRAEVTLLFRVRDWRGAGGMVGPVYFAGDPSERIF